MTLQDWLARANFPGEIKAAWAACHYARLCGFDCRVDPETLSLICSGPNTRFADKELRHAGFSRRRDGSYCFSPSFCQSQKTKARAA